MKADQLPALLDVFRTARREKAETIGTVPDKSPAGERQSNGKVEYDVQIVDGQIRTMKLALEKRYDIRILKDFRLLSWVFIYAASILICFAVKGDGGTAWESRRGKKSHRQLLELGERICNLRFELMRIDKLGIRWGGGVF